tara:strand:- start:703 stop:1077 length:375 start_codon:yes stop_codon:yes gene_type:complete
MTTTPTERLPFEPIDNVIIRNLLDHVGNDGHSMWNPTASIFDELPKEFIEELTETHVSDGSHKGSIWKNGFLVKETQAIYALDLLWALCAVTEADTDDPHGLPTGRGFLAQHLTRAIQKKVEQQ